MIPSRQKLFFILVLAVLMIPVTAQEQSANEKQLEITYIANAGFLIEYNSKKVLIDALHSWPNFQSTPDEVFNNLLNNKPPFDNIDLILVTHEHSDHFNPKIVKYVMSKQKKAVFIAPHNAVELLKIVKLSGQDKILESQIREVNIKFGDVIELSENGIDLKILGLDEGDGMLNLGFLININGKKLYHQSDIGQDLNVDYFKSAHLEKENVNVMFVDSRFRSNPVWQNIIKQYIKPKNIIAMHIQPASFDSVSKEIKERYPDVIIFEKPMQSRVFK